MNNFVLKRYNLFNLAARITFNHPLVQHTLNTFYTITTHSSPPSICIVNRALISYIAFSQATAMVS